VVDATISKCGHVWDYSLLGCRSESVERLRSHCLEDAGGGDVDDLHDESAK